MKKMMIIGGSFLVTTLMAHAESLPIRINAPLATSKMTIPAGNYTLSLSKSNPAVMLLEGKGVRTFVFGRVVYSTPYAKPIVELDLARPAAAVAAPVDEPVKLAVTGQ